MFRIVIANHDESMNARLERSLQLNDAVRVVGVATNGLDALDLVWECEPNVIVVGPVRPPMGGRTLLNLVRAARPFTLLVALEEATHGLGVLPEAAHALLRHDSHGRVRLLTV